MVKKRFSKKKYKTKIITVELYEKWKKNYPELSLSISYSNWKKYLKSILNEYTNEILVNPHGVRLPFYMGDLDLKYIPKKETPIDFANSKPGSNIIHMNFTTNGRVGKVVWSGNHAKRFNEFLPVLAFQATKNCTDKAKQQFKDNPELFKDAARSKNNRKFNNN